MKQGGRLPWRSISRASASARRGRSTVSIASKSATASRTLLVCSGPMRWRRRSGVRCLQRRVFRLRLLHAVLAEEAVAGGERRGDRRSAAGSWRPRPAPPRPDRARPRARRRRCARDGGEIGGDRRGIAHARDTGPRARVRQAAGGPRAPRSTPLRHRLRRGNIAAARCAVGRCRGRREFVHDRKSQRYLSCRRRRLRRLLALRQRPVERQRSRRRQCAPTIPITPTRIIPPIPTSIGDRYAGVTTGQDSILSSIFGSNDKHGSGGGGGGGGAGVGVNSYLWHATLDTVSFMPLASADPFGGVIITDWYSPPGRPHRALQGQHLHPRPRAARRRRARQRVPAAARRQRPMAGRRGRSRRPGPISRTRS